MPGLWSAVNRGKFSGWCELKAMRHVSMIAGVAESWDRPSLKPGSHVPVWPAGAPR